MSYWNSIIRFKFILVPVAVVAFTYLHKGHALTYREVFIFGVRIASFGLADR